MNRVCDLAPTRAISLVPGWTVLPSLPSFQGAPCSGNMLFPATTWDLHIPGESFSERHRRQDEAAADAVKRVQDRVIGKYRVIVESRNKARKPKQWDLWAEHNDRVHAVAEPTADFHAPPADATTATIPLTIRVFVWHEDGDTTPLYTTQAQASMVKEPDSDAWKLSDLEYVGTISQ